MRRDAGLIEEIPEAPSDKAVPSHRTPKNRTMTRKIIALVDDMFFASKIRATAEAVGVDVSFPRTKDVALEKLRDAPPDLILADLQNQRFDVIEFASALKADDE